MNEVLRSILESQSAVGPDGSNVPIHSYIPKDEGTFLQDLISDRRPVVSLEIGCAFGVSSLYICEALARVAGQKHIVIDPFQNHPEHPWKGIGIANIERAGYGNLVELRQKLSYIAIPQLAEEGVRVDFAFIDGQHTFDYVLVDFFLVDKLLNVGGIIVLDDYTYASIRKVCRYVARNLPYRCIGPSNEAVITARGRLMHKLANYLPFSRWSRVELRIPDRQLGLPSYGRYIAFEKLGEDRVGDGNDGPSYNRRWDDHNEF